LCANGLSASLINPNYGFASLPSAKLSSTLLPGAYFLSRAQTVEVPREGGEMGKRKKKVKRDDWQKKATKLVHLLGGYVLIFVAIEKAAQSVTNNWPF
jgi:hypothetical protein